jgi:hypothetical protein
VRPIHVMCGRFTLRSAPILVASEFELRPGRLRLTHVAGLACLDY